MKKNSGRPARTRGIIGSKWIRIWLRLGILALLLLAAGLTLMAVAAGNSRDAEPAVPVQGEQIQTLAPEALEFSEKGNPSDETDRTPTDKGQSSEPGEDSTQSSEHEEFLTLADFPSPVQGPVLRAVGNYYSEEIKDYLYHTGTDYLQAEGAMITATRGGTVTYAGPDPFLGQKVEIDCGEGWFVTYGCLDNLRVKTGDKVEPGVILGQVALDGGPDAMSGQTQLHYEVRYGDEVIE